MKIIKFLSALILIPFIFNGCSSSIETNENAKLSLISKSTPKIFSPGKGEYSYTYSANKNGKIEWKLEIYEKGKLKEKKQNEIKELEVNVKHIIENYDVAYFLLVSFKQ